jgi:3',5'-cyclic AMP phosphodiesterase CpdA
MSDPFVLVQLSDPHIGATWADADPVAGLEAAVKRVAGLKPAADAIVLTGDLADNGSEAEYEQVQNLLSILEAPLHVLPGNHDDRATMRRCFHLPGEGADPVNYVAELGPLRLLVLDTTIPGSASGSLDVEWLDAQLAAAPDMPAVVAMHHPAMLIGIPAGDEMGIGTEELGELASVLERHPHALRLIGGHVHRVVSGQLGGRSVFTAPSTYVQTVLNFTTREIILGDEPTGFAVHLLRDGGLVTHVSALPRPPGLAAQPDDA